MKLFLAKICADGYMLGYLGYMDSWDCFTSMADAKLFTDEGDVEEQAKDFVKYMGQAYSYVISPVTLTIGV